MRNQKLEDFPDLDEEEFSDLPNWLFEGMTTEQINRKIELYRLAYDQAREHSRRRESEREWIRTMGLHLGEGI